MSIKVVTHSQTFHADECFAVAMLRIAFQGDIQLIRTREPFLLRRYADDENALLLDVGGQYDPQKGLFDHHQPEGAGFRRPHTREWPYATAGLVWKSYAPQVILALHPSLSNDDVQEIAGYVDESLLKYIDATDCGVRLKSAGPSISGIVASFNPSWIDADDADEFPLVLDLAQVILTNLIKRHAGSVLAREKVREAQATRDGRVLILEKCHPWSFVVAHELPDVLFVVYPVDAEGARWQARTAADADDSPRIRYPASWAGLEGARLQSLAGPDAVFCHRSRHLAGSVSMSGILAMVDSALAEFDAFDENQMLLPLAA